MLRTTFALLRGGLRLALLRRPHTVPLDTGPFPFLLFTGIVLALAAAGDWHVVDAPRVFNSAGVQSALGDALVLLVVAALLCAICARRALLWAAAAWLQAAAIVPGLVVMALLAAWGWDFFTPWSFGLLLLWQIAVMVRLAWFLADRHVGRALAASAAACVLTLLSTFLLEQQWLWSTDWEAHEGAEGFVFDAREPGELDAPEAAMYAQPERLEQAVAGLAPQRPGAIDLYVLAFGGDASENVFRNEVDYVERLFPARFGADGRVLALLNHPDSVERRPLATATNLERGLAALGRRLDPAEDIVFLYLTSHGSAEHELYVNQPPLPLDQLTPERLRAALDASGIGWRVIVVSACYSGGYIDALRDPQTLVITAARADRTSFGCGAESDVTWFGHAFLAEALNETTDLREAFDLAVQRIAEREKADDYTPSEPQWDAGDRILGHLEQWRAALRPGPPVPFAPNSGIVDAHSATDDKALPAAKPTRKDSTTATHQ